MGWRERMFNADQLEYMDYLGTLTAEQKCACGWNLRGECYGSCRGDAEKGGVVCCGEAHPKIASVLCTNPKGHVYDHSGLERIGGGGRSVSWPLASPDTGREG